MNYYRQYFMIDQGKVLLDSDMLSLDRSDRSEIIIKVKYCGLCNSDIKEICGNRIKRRDFGHELLGWVVETQNIDLPIGAAVTLDPHIEVSRGTCFANYVKLSSPDPNTLRRAVIDLPRFEVRFALVEPIACAIHAVNRLLSVTHSYQHILVHGCGTFGLIIYHILKFKGYQVSLGNRSRERLSFVEARFVNTRLFDSTAIMEEFDAVVLASSYLSLADILPLTKNMTNGCSVLLFGAVDPCEEMDLYHIRNTEREAYLNIGDKGIIAVGNLGATHNDFREAIASLLDRDFGEVMDRVAARIVPPKDGLRIINDMTNGADCFGKTLIDFQEFWG